MTVRDSIKQSRPDHTRSITGDQGNVFAQDVDRMVTRDSITEDTAKNTFDERDVGTGGDTINLIPDTLGGATTIMVALTSDDNLEFDVSFHVVDDDGNRIYPNIAPARFQNVTEIWGQFPVLHPTMEVGVEDAVHEQNRVSGGISFRTGDSDAMVDYGLDDFVTDQVTADTAADVGSVLPLTSLATAVPRGTKVAVKALTDNAGPVFIGDIDDVTTSNGMELAADQGVELSANAVEDIGMIAQNQGDGVSWIVEVA